MHEDQALPERGPMQDDSQAMGAYSHLRAFAPKNPL
jgi:hypothetical protein